MVKCLILQNEEIEEQECALVTIESYKGKPSKELPKRFKRIAGWDWICKSCANHKKPKD